MNVLEIGGGENPRYRPNLDYRHLSTVDIVHDITILPWPLDSNTFDFIYSSHTLEHLPPEKVPPTLREIGRILKPYGKIELHVPDIEALCKFHDWEFAVKTIYGASTPYYGIHQSGFWKLGLEYLMQKLGYSNVEVSKSFYPYSTIHATPELVCTAQKIVVSCRSLVFTPKDKF